MIVSSKRNSISCENIYTNYDLINNKSNNDQIYTSIMNLTKCQRTIKRDDPSYESIMFNSESQNNIDKCHCYCNNCCCKKIKNSNKPKKCSILKKFINILKK